MVHGIAILAKPEWEQDVLKFVKEKKIHLGGKVLDQYLEQLRAMVELKTRCHGVF